MRILINAYSARLGGGQTYLINLLRRLPEDPSLELLVYAPASLELPNDPRIERLTSKWPTTNPIARALWERLVLPKVLRARSVDVLFCPGGVIATRVPRGCRKVTMFRNMMPFDMRARLALPFGPQRARLWLLERVMLKSMAAADLVIFISEFAREVIASRISVRQSVTIPHGVPEAFKTADRAIERPPFVPEDDYILYVSRFDLYKHHFEVVSAYARLPEALRSRYRLLLIGESDMPEADRVRELIAHHGLGERVVILGAVKYPLLPAAYRHAALILFASSCENCPNILLEALGAGRPVLSSSVDPMPEFAGDAARYFDPRKPEEIEAAMLDVLQNPALASELGDRASERSRRYDWSKTAEATWQRILSL
ncbi:glycosyltransferase family 4 protein [Trinickia sp.]|uniref:glycosyltransferase family 4 protein n=1 Tax=Trinickia sp. TaxID=2571163 RepID=UPI003F8238AA